MFDHVALAVAMFVVAGTLLVAGWQLPVGENDHVYWDIRGPVWGLAGLAILSGLVSLFSRPLGD